MLRPDSIPLYPGFGINIGTDGTWITFSPKGGPEGAINLNVLADRAGGITRRAILNWLKDLHGEDRSHEGETTSVRREL